MTPDQLANLRREAVDALANHPNDPDLNVVAVPCADLLGLLDALADDRVCPCGVSPNVVGWAPGCDECGRVWPETLTTARKMAAAITEEHRVSSFYVAQLREIRADLELRESIPSGATDGGSFWSYDGADLEFHDNQTDARETAVRALALEADQAGSDGWDDNVQNIAWGFCVVVESVKETARQDGHLPTCDEDCDEACKLTSGFDSWADYGLVSVKP